MDLMARRRAIMGMPSGKDYTVTGNVVSISNALAKNAKSAIVTFLPKQSGSGDPSPSNVRPISGYNDIGAVRYGKNLLPTATYGGLGYNVAVGTVLTPTTASKQWQDNGNGTFTISSLGSWAQAGLISAPLPLGKAYLKISNLTGGLRVSVYVCNKDLKINRTSLLKNPASEGETIYVDTTFVNDDRYFVVYLSGSGANASISQPYVYTGDSASTDPYEPYISPVTANVHVGGAGKNKLNPATTSLTNSTVFGLSATWSADGVLHFSGTWTGATANSVRVLEVDSSVRSLSVKGFSTGHVSLRWQNGEDRIVADFASMTNGSTYDITVWPMVYKGTAPTAYEPYSIFGGTVDLVSGELVVDMGYVDLGTKNYLYRNSRFDATFSDGKLTLLNSGGAKAIASAYARSTNAYNSIPDLAFNFGSGYVNGSTCSIVVHDSRYTDATSFKSAVSGVILCYELATPITYHLTPSQLAMLKGNNTVYSNEGSISLTYVGK